MENALEYFCPLSESKQEEFIACPQLSLEAVEYFSLAKAIDCTSKDDMVDYVSNCDLVCLGIKAQVIESFKATEEASDEYYSAEIAKFEEEYDWQTKAAGSLTSLAELCSTAKEEWSSSDPTAFEQKFNDQIDNSVGLSDEEKTELKTYVSGELQKTIDGTSTFNEMESDFMKKIVIAESAADSAASSKDGVATQKSSVKQLGSSIKT